MLLTTMSGDFSRAIAILRSVYPIVQTAEDFSKTIVFKEGRRAVLVEPSDTERYKCFLKGLYVCTNKMLQQVPSCNQITTLSELLALVVNNMRSKRKRNVLCHGYAPRDCAYTDMLKFHTDVMQSVAYVNGSDFWKKVHNRMGTDVTKYLLECCALFVAVPPSCMFQVCGVPLYDCIATGTRSGFRLSRPRASCLPRGGANVRATRPRWEVGAVRRHVHGGGRWRAARKRRRSPLNGHEEEETPGLADGQPPPKRMRCDLSGNKTTNQTGPSSSATLPEDCPPWRIGKYPPASPAHCFVRSLALLYGGRGIKTFLLNRKLKTETGHSRQLQGQDVVRLVFFEGLPYLRGVAKKPRKLPARFHAMTGVFARLLQGHRQCPYLKLLQRMCPAVGTDSDIDTLLACHSTGRQVFLFVRECLCRVVPGELWGSAHNCVRFLSSVKGFLNMGKFERLSVSELLWKMRVEDCDWLKMSKNGRCPPSEHRYRERVLGQFLTWLLDGYVVGLVRALFYVTESAGQKNALRFYREHVWARVQRLAFRKHLASGQWQSLSQEQVCRLPKNTAMSRLRFIPKLGGTRPIMRMPVMDTRTWPWLKDLYDVLQACVRDRPHLLGSTVFGLQDIHRVLAPVVALQKENPRPLYFVKVDVSGAYDSLPHDKLLQVVSEVLSPASGDNFSIRCYAQVWSEANEGIRKIFRRQANIGSDSEPVMKGFLMALQRKGKVHNSIFVEQHFSTDVYGRDVLESFKKMLANFVIVFEKKMFRQCRGIPQGSLVSTFLCCLCYGHMENTLLQHVTEGGGCLLRLVDDFLLITPELSRAQTFLRTFTAGIPEYGCFVNPEKVAVNFPVEGEAAMSGVCLLPSCCLFPWCGLFLDTYSLDVYNDYSSYAGLSLRCSLTLGSAPQAGEHMRRKLLAILRLKCHALLMDLKINSLEAVYHNIYKIVLLQAYRFHACAQNLPFGQKVSKNPKYFDTMIWEMAKQTNLLIRGHNTDMPLGSRSMTGCLQYEAVELMFCISFLVVLSRHRSLYKGLLPHLRMRKKRLERRLGTVRMALVRRASTPLIPEDFKAICM